jgi:uncharacterized protein YbjQ (UPF0145 family)
MAELTLDVSRVTTTSFLPGYRILHNVGVVQGIAVRKAGIANIFGVALTETVIHQLRTDAFRIMLDRGRELEANAIVGLQYIFNTGSMYYQAPTVVIAYGTAVVVETRRQSS